MTESAPNEVSILNEPFKYPSAETSTPKFSA